MATLSYYNILQRANPLYFLTPFSTAYSSPPPVMQSMNLPKKPLKQTTNKALQNDFLHMK